MKQKVPTRQDILLATQTLAGKIINTPTIPLTSERWDGILPTNQNITLKLELFQQSGSFKARGALLGIDGLTDDQRLAGVVAASGGNHAIAVSWAGRAAGVEVKITMPQAADPMRVERCKALGANVTLCDDIAHAFATMEEFASKEGLSIMHPFEGRHMTLGAATCGWEYGQAHPNIDLFIIPVGGGGLIGGMAMALKTLQPNTRVIGVEPFGADSLWQSLNAGKPMRIDKVDTIADSLGSPFALPYSFSIAQTFVDEVVRVNDDDLRVAMRHYRDNLNLITEPGCAASLAALIGPLADRVEGLNVGLIACGTNIGMDRYTSILAN